MYPVTTYRSIIIAIFLVLLAPVWSWADPWDTATWDQDVWDANSSPVAVDATFETSEDTEINGTLNASDAEDNPFTYQIVSNGAKGIPVITDAVSGAFTYTPQPNITGTDIFTFKAHGDTVDSNVATVTVTIVAVNDPPTASNSVLPLNESTTHTLSTTDFGYHDIEEDTLNKIKVTSLPSVGVLSLNGNPVSVNNEITASDIGAGSLVYSPPQGLVQSTSVVIQYLVHDGTTYSNSSYTLTIGISLNIARWDDAIWDDNDWILEDNTNYPPVTIDAIFETSEDTAVNGTLNASDAEDNPFTYQIVSNGTKGIPVITDAVSGAFTYTPQPNITGTDTFTFKAHDDTVDSNIATVTVTIVAVNDPPTASNSVLPLNESTTHTLSTTDFGYHDIEEDTLNKIKVTSLPSVGVLSLNGNPVSVNNEITASDIGAGSLVYSPPQGLVQSTSVVIQYLVHDGTTYSNSTYTLTIGISLNTARWDDAIWDDNDWVSEDNNAPIAGNNQFETTENLAVSGTLQAIDPEESNLTFQMVSQGTLGTTTITNIENGQFTYVPKPNLHGTDTFTFRANDGSLNSNIATVTVIIDPLNRVPTANNYDVTINEDSIQTGILSAYDSNGDPLVYSLLTNGTLGTATITNTATGAFNYVPNENTHGTDTLTYSVHDGQVDSNPATITIHILPVNDAPVANAGTISIQEDHTGYSGVLAATDVDGNSFVFSLIQNGNLGTVTITNQTTGAYTYIPKADANGTDTFTFKAKDSQQVDSNIATMTITIQSVNDIPLANSSTFTIEEDTIKNGTLTAHHPDAHATTFTIVQSGSKGTATITNAATGEFTYVSNTNAHGSDTFTFKVSDEDGESNVVAVEVTIQPINDIPLSVDGLLSTNENQSASGLLVANDADGDTLTYSIVANGTLGTATITDDKTGAYTYTPNANVSGSDTFTFRVYDGAIESSTATVTINIITDSTPTITSIENQTIINEDGSSVTLNFTVSDNATGAADLQVTASSSNPTLVPEINIILGGSGANRTVTITPADNQSGTATITLLVSDGTLKSTSSFTLTVTIPNHAPESIDGTLGTYENTPADSLLLASDADGDTLTYSIDANGTLGMATITDDKTGAYTYVPNANVSGGDIFTFKVYDGTVESSAASVTVTIIAEINEPVVNAGTLETEEDTPAIGTLSASDVDGDSLIFSIVSNGILGKATVTDDTTGAYTYTPKANANGTDTFTFQVYDGTLTSNTATVTVTINPGMDDPVTVNDFMSVTAGVTNSFNPLDNDWDPDENDTLTITEVTQGNKGSVVLGEANEITYTTTSDKSGADDFTYTVTDGHGGTDAGTVTVWIEPQTTFIKHINFPDVIRAEGSFELSVDITTASDTTITNIFWDFGDGTTGTGAQVSHTYEEPGVYMVTTMIVTSNSESKTLIMYVRALAPRYKIQGTLSGLAVGETVTVMAYSNSKNDLAIVEIIGTGQDLEFTLDDLTPANDYRIQWLSETYPDGYWSGEPGEGSSGVQWQNSSTLDISHGSINGIDIQLATGRSVTITISGGTSGDLFDVTIWSETTKTFADKIITFPTTGINTQVEAVLKALRPATDYKLHIEPLSGDYRAGYYSGEGNPLGGYTRAVPLNLAIGNDLSVSISLVSGRNIRGTIFNLPTGKRAWVDAWSHKTNQGKGVETEGTGENLTYIINGLPLANDYKVCIDVEGLIGGCHAGTDNTELVPYTQSVPIDLSGNNRNGVDFTIISGRSISGTISGFAEGDVVFLDAWSTSDSHWTTTMMNSDGSYLLEGLRLAADYEVTISARGYQNLPAVVVDVTDGDVTSKDFTLYTGGSITGTVTGLQKGDVVAISARSKNANTIETVLTAQDTLPLPYTLEGVGIADYIVSVRGPKGRFYYSASEGAIRGRSSATGISASVFGTVSGINFNLGDAKSYSLSGTISGLDDANAPDTIVTISAWSEEGAFESTSRSGDGAFTIGSLPAGSYYVAVSASGFVDRYYSTNSASSWVESHQDQATTLAITNDVTDLAISLVSGHAISGTVTDESGKALKNEYVNAWDKTKNVGGGSQTLVDGSYKIEGLPNTDYDLEVISKKGKASKKNVEVSGSDVTEQDLTIIKQAGKISGKISGTNASEAMVMVYDIDSGNFVVATSADKNGNYIVEDLAIGKEYRVDVETNDDLSSVEGTGSVVVNDGNARLNITLQENISGTWTLIYSIPGEDVPETVIIVQNNNSLNIFSGLIAPCNGTIDGSSINLTCTGAENEGAITLTANLSNPQTLSGNISGAESGTFTGTKTSDSVEQSVFNIPTANITIDGDLVDWDSVDTFINDDNSANDNVSLQGTDIEFLKIALNSNRTIFYFQIKTKNNINTNFWYRMWFDHDMDGQLDGDLDDRQIDIQYNGMAWDVVSQDMNNQNWNLPDGGVVSTNGKYIEGSVDIGLLGLQNKFYFSGVSMGSSTPYNRYDWFGYVGTVEMGRE